jgi:hypothetical protein
MLSLTYTISFLNIMLEFLIVISPSLIFACLSIGLLSTCTQLQSRYRTKRVYAHSYGSKQRSRSIAPVCGTTHVSFNATLDIRL